MADQKKVIIEIGDDEMSIDVDDDLFKEMKKELGSLLPIGEQEEDTLADFADNSDTFEEAFEKGLDEPEPEKQPNPHQFAIDRATRAKALAEERDISMGQAIVMVMEEERSEDETDKAIKAIAGPSMEGVTRNSQEKPDETDPTTGEETVHPSRHSG